MPTIAEKMNAHSVALANELMPDAVDGQRKEIRRLEGIIAALPARLEKIIREQESILIEVAVPFNKCPGCKNETPRFGEKRRCGSCGLFNVQWITVTHPKTYSLSDVIFDQAILSAKEQAEFLVPLLTGAVKIVPRCIECQEPKEDCTCDRGDLCV